MYDWIAIKNEYINGNISYRELSEKYDIPFHTLSRKAVDEKWHKLRVEQRKIIAEKTQKKTAEKIAEKQSDFAVELQDTAYRLLQKIKKAVDESDCFIERTKIRVPKKVLDKKTGETITAWQEEETIRVERKDRENTKTLAELISAIKTLQTITDNGINMNAEMPTINISVMAATEDDIEEE